MGFHLEHNRATIHFPTIELPVNEPNFVFPFKIGFNCPNQVVVIVLTNSERKGVIRILTNSKTPFGFNKSTLPHREIALLANFQLHKFLDNFWSRVILFPSF